jgi:hypothetical protein
MYQTYIQYFTFCFVLNSLIILLYLTLRLTAMGEAVGGCAAYRLPLKNTIVCHSERNEVK